MHKKCSVKKSITYKRNVGWPRNESSTDGLHQVCMLECTKTEALEWTRWMFTTYAIAKSHICKE